MKEFGCTSRSGCWFKSSFLGIFTLRLVPFKMNPQCCKYLAQWISRLLQLPYNMTTKRFEFQNATNSIQHQSFCFQTPKYCVYTTKLEFLFTKCCIYHSKWKVRAPKCCKHHRKWKVVVVISCKIQQMPYNMRGYSSKMLQIPCNIIVAFPKCGKYHAKCTVLSANCCIDHAQWEVQTPKRGIYYTNLEVP